MSLAWGLFSLEHRMRRLSGMYDGKPYEIFEYTSGHVECHPALAKVLALDDCSLPQGEALEDACLVLFGDSLTVSYQPEQEEA
jgi:hypothetical protein